MRLSVALLALVVLLAAGFASAGRMSSAEVPEEVKASPPPGTYWSEELGVFVFDPPIPLRMPESNLLTYPYQYELWNDNSCMHFATWQQPGYFVMTKFTVPDDYVPEGLFEIWEIWIACVNGENAPPDEGKLKIMAVDYTECPQGGLGEELGAASFVGVLWEGPVPPVEVPPPANWTIITLDETVLIDVSESREFWVVWDYNPSEPMSPGGYYVSGGFRNPNDPEMTFYESNGFCPQYGTAGPWIIHVFGNERTGYPDHVDVKPTSCPNPIKEGEIGLTSVAIVGSNDWSAEWVVEDECYILVDPLEGDDYEIQAYSTSGPEDVVAPTYEGGEWTGGGGEECECTEDGPDDITDFVFKFETLKIWLALVDMYYPLTDSAWYPVTFKFGYDYDHDGEWDPEDPKGWLTGVDCFRVSIPGLKAGETQPGGSEPTLGATRVGDASVFALHQNTPNPFRGETTVSFSIPSSCRTTLTVHDVSGRTIATLVDGELSAGTHAVEWDAAVPSGVYFCRLVAGGETAGSRMVVAR
jgi:hypothetical protein